MRAEVRNVFAHPMPVAEPFDKLNCLGCTEVKSRHGSMHDRQDSRDHRIGNDNLFYHYSRRMSLPPIQQSITNYETLKLMSELEQAFLVMRDGRFWGYISRTDPGSDLPDD